MASTRPSLAAVAAMMLALTFVAGGMSAEPTPIDQALAVQATLAEARDLLTANQTAEAVTLLERQLPNADGNRAYLELLRSAYIARIKKLQVTAGDPIEVANLTTKLGLLGVTEIPRSSSPTPTPAINPTKPAPVVQTAAPQPGVPTSPKPGTQTTELLSQAAALFNEAKAEPAKFELAARMFAAAYGNRVELRDDQRAAWAYCRLRVAAEHLNHAGSDPVAVARVVAEVEEALAIAPENAALKKVGTELLAAAKTRAGSMPQPRIATADGWEIVETGSFVIRHRGQQSVAQAIATTAEEKRNVIFTRWSGPAGGAWEPKCTITLHPAATDFAAATKQPTTATGQATVHLHEGRVTERRIDLRADDMTITENALPRELTHLILADLFPTKAPPRWAVEGMAVLAASPVELDRYLRTLPRCREAGELLTVETLFNLKSPPSDKVTGYYVGSVSLVDFLVRWKGDKAFTTFLRDSQRYGLESAMKRQYGIENVKQLESAWLQAASAVSIRD